MNASRSPVGDVEERREEAARRMPGSFAAVALGFWDLL
jgi:hypothetical protein